MTYKELLQSNIEQRLSKLKQMPDSIPEKSSLLALRFYLSHVSSDEVAIALLKVKKRQAKEILKSPYTSKWSYNKAILDAINWCSKLIHHNNKNKMKNYIGTKSVKATPMTMGEAYERKLLKEGVRPSECETDKAGYIVEYEDGYQSWCPAEPFEKAYRLSDSFLDRLRIEYDEVKSRLERLQYFFAIRDLEELEDQVGSHQAALLLMQQTFMKEYVKVLKARIEDYEKEDNK